MVKNPRHIVIGATFAVLVAACSPAETADTIPAAAPSTSEATTTTAAPTTTTTAVPTTTEAPIADVKVGGDLDAELASALAMALTSLNDPRADGPVVAEMAAALTDVAGQLEDTYTATASTSELATGGRVGVATLDSGDVVLVADEGSGWIVVGANLSSVRDDPWYGTSPRRVLVLGSDARPGANADVHRMDSIHILTAVPELNAGAILGYPRDSWGDTAYGAMRLNALTSSGRGPDAIFEHFTDAWEVPVEGYILTGFSGFEKLMAATIGRLRITIPIPIPAQKEFPGFSKGEQTLTPARALDFSRTRKLIPGGDFSRSLHHGIVMLAALTAIQDGSMEDLPALLEPLSRFTSTNLKAADLIQLGAIAMEMDITAITNEVLPGSLGRAGGGQSVVFLDDGYEVIVTDVIDDGLRNDSSNG